jgi:beta-galactosidase/beta-glucuronidase
VLYRITVAVHSPGSVDERSVRFGFRDFRFENGFFRLNGERIFLKGSNFSKHYPVGYTVPLSEDMLRKDIINM